ARCRARDTSHCGAPVAFLTMSGNSRGRLPRIPSSSSRAQVHFRREADIIRQANPAELVENGPKGDPIHRRPSSSKWFEITMRPIYGGVLSVFEPQCPS